jgi:MFS family permease
VPAPLVGLLAAHTVSETGNTITLIALPLYVLATTGSPAATGITGAVATVPIIIGGALGGVLVDRVGYRRTSVLADAVGAVTIAAVPVLDVTVGLPFWALLVLVFATGLLDTPGQVARASLLPQAAAAAGVPLERAAGWFDATERGSRLLGAPLAGLLVASLGALNALALDAASFAVAAALVFALLPRPDSPRWATASSETGEALETSAPTGADGYWRQLGQGMAFLAREPLLRAVVIMVMVTNFLDATKTTVLLPVATTRQYGGAAAFGLLLGTLGGTALIGALVFSAIGHRLPRRATFVAAFAIGGPPTYFALAADLPLPAVVAVTALSGLGVGAINPIIATVKLERVPAGMRARVYGVIGAAAWLAMPAGSVAAGYAVQHAGLTATLYAVGAAYLLTTLTPLLGGAWKRMGPPRQR